jgi:hypothetical protein
VLEKCEICHKGFEALAQSELLEQLIQLDLASNPSQEHLGVLTLFRSPRTAHLKYIRVTTSGFLAFVSSLLDKKSSDDRSWPIVRSRLFTCEGF